MTLKTFNLNQEVYGKFSAFCKGHGISMSKQIELFMESQIENEPEVKRTYLEKLNNIRKGRFIIVKNFTEKYGLE